MKKLLVLTLAVVLTLSLTVVAFAATFEPYVGGRVQVSYVDSDKDAPVSDGNSGLKMKLQGKVSDEETGTWAHIGSLLSGWPDSGKDLHYKNIFDCGINNIGGSNLSIWYTDWENENMKRGQAQVYNILPNQYHDDPMFNHALGHGFGFDYVTDSAKINIGYDPNKNALDKNTIIAAATFNFEGGNVHVGYTSFVKGIDTNGDEKNEDYLADETNVGAEFKLGFGTIKADYVSLNNDKCAWEGGDIIQVAAFFEELGLDITVISDSKYKFRTDGGMGYQIRYTGIDNVTFGYRAMEANEAADEGDNFTDLFIGYKFGIFETRIGMGTKGESDNNDFVYASAYASLW